MSKIYVFDTNIISDVLDSPQSPISKRIIQLEKEAVILCQPVIYEVERGLTHRQAHKQLRRFRLDIMPMFQIIDVLPQDWQSASVLWAFARAKGRQLSDIDILIATITLRLGGIVVTDDKDFDELPIDKENWLRQI